MESHCTNQSEAGDACGACSGCEADLVEIRAEIAALSDQRTRLELAIQDNAPVVLHLSAMVYVTYSGGTVTELKIVPDSDGPLDEQDAVSDHGPTSPRLAEALAYVNTHNWAPLAELPKSVVWEV